MIIFYFDNLHPNDIMAYFYPPEFLWNETVFNEEINNQKPHTAQHHSILSGEKWMQNLKP